jgi:hypothetical protein
MLHVDAFCNCIIIFFVQRIQTENAENDDPLKGNGNLVETKALIKDHKHPCNSRPSCHWENLN